MTSSPVDPRLQCPAWWSVLREDIAFADAWPKDQRALFLVGLLEALGEALRTDDPLPVAAFVRLMADPDVAHAGPTLTGVFDEGDEQQVPSRLRRSDRAASPGCKSPSP